MFLRGDRWGELCAMLVVAAEWAERLKPALIESFISGRKRSSSYFHGCMACFSEGHGFARPESNRRFNAAAEAFLGKYLGGRIEPAAPDESVEAFLH